MRSSRHPSSVVRTTAVVVFRGVLLIGLVFTVDRAFAAGKVFRCGNTFQDQPCAAAPAEPTKPADKAPQPKGTLPAASPATIVRADMQPSRGAGDRLVVEPSRELANQARR